MQRQKPRLAWRLAAGFACLALAAVSAQAPQAQVTGKARTIAVDELDGPPRIGVISFEGQIDEHQAKYLKRRIAQAEDDGCHIIILDMETYGGRVDSAAEIRDALLDTDLVTVTYVNNRAISAGALIAIACQHIYVSPSATMGAAAPVVIGFDGATPGDEKITSDLRAEFRATAEATGRDPAIAETMVDKDLALPGISDAGKLLTFTASEAVEAGYAEGMAIGLDEVARKLGEDLGFSNYTTTYYSFTGAERAARFLSNPLISSILTILALVLLFVEGKTPGFGVAGGLSLACFAILFWGQYIANLAGWEEIVLFLLGIGLLAFEVFVTPGFGIPGILGILSLTASIIFAFTAFSPSDPFFYPQEFSLPSMLQPVFMFSTVLIVSLVLMVILASLLPSTPMFTAITLATSETREEGYYSSEDNLDALIGQHGITISSLRPAGIMAIGEERYDVVSEGGMVPANREVEVVGVEGRRVIVRETETA